METAISSLGGIGLLVLFDSLTEQTGVIIVKGIAFSKFSETRNHAIENGNVTCRGKKERETE